MKNHFSFPNFRNLSLIRPAFLGSREATPDNSRYFPKFKNTITNKNIYLPFLFLQLQLESNAGDFSRIHFPRLGLAAAKADAWKSNFRQKASPIARHCPMCLKGDGLTDSSTEDTMAQKKQAEISGGFVIQQAPRATRPVEVVKGACVCRQEAR